MKHKTIISLFCIAVFIITASVVYMTVLKPDNNMEKENKAEPYSVLDKSINIQRKELRINTYIANRLSGIGKNGYSIVMDNKTGEILSLTSVINGKNVLIKPDEKTDLLPISGSALKLLYSVPVIEEGIDEMTLKDEGYTELETGEKIYNIYKTAFGYTGFESALNNKSNVWFAKAFERISEDKLIDFNNRILLEKSIDLGFTSLKTSHDDSVNPIITASVGKGLSIDPVYMCSILCGISNGTGKAMKPYFKSDSNPTILLEFTNSNTASTLRDYLKNCGRRHDVENTCFTIHRSDSTETGFICYCANDDYTILCSADCSNSMSLEHTAYDILLRINYT